MRVLVVDDDNDDREIISYYLEQTGKAMEIVEAHNSAEALERLEGVDLAFVDIRLGNDNGIELVRTLQERNVPAHRIVIMSGSVVEEEMARAEDLGVLRVLDKNEISARELADILSEVG